MRYCAVALHERPSLRFLILLTIWGLVFTAVVTNATVMAAVVVPFSRWQGEIVAWYLGVRSLPVSVVPSCSGLDAMSLCVAAVLAFPRGWRQRLAGAGAGLVLLLIVNLARIGSLAASADSPWFDLLHIVVWPAVLMPEDAELFDRRARTSAERAAEVILRGVERDRERIYVGVDAWLLAGAKRVAPALTVRLTGRASRSPTGR